MSRFRVALATTELAVGGAERCLTQLALGLDRQQFAPEVYSLAARPDPARAQLVEQLEQAGIPVHFINATSSSQLPAAIARLSGLFEEQRPDLLQTFLFHANVVGTFAARRAGVQRIVHGIRVADPRRWRHWLERVATRHASRVVCVSRSVAKFARHRCGIPSEKIIVIPNGIDLSRFASYQAISPDQLGLHASKNVFTCVARLDRQKGIDWLLESLPSLLEEFPHHDLLLVGDGPDREILEATARINKIADRVHFLGWRHDVLAILQASSAMVLPSRWEGMPNALLEAMACGLPVLATRVEGVEEVVGPFAEEQLVNHGDSESLRSKLANLLRDPAHAKQLGLANQRHVDEHFSLSQMIAAYSRLYRQLLD
ncbi:MAG: 2-deoxystreptamine glucosyltransferase [Planctomycetota bacterium]